MPDLTRRANFCRPRILTELEIIELRIDAYQTSAAMKKILAKKIAALKARQSDAR